MFIFKSNQFVINIIFFGLLPIPLIFNFATVISALTITNDKLTPNNINQFFNKLHEHKMKLKKFLAFLIIGIATCIGFSACSDDDDNDKTSENSLIGRWNHSEFDDEEGETISTLQFQKNGKGTVIVISQLDPEENVINPFSWSLTGNIAEEATLTIEGKNADDNEPVIEIYSAYIIDDVLYLKDGEGELSVWNKAE